jgi:hypothetical protein
MTVRLSIGGRFIMPKKKIKKGERYPKLVIIEWLDAFDGPTGWLYLEEYKPKSVKPITTGWILPDFLEGYTTVVSTYLQDFNEKCILYSDPVHIPNGMVHSITYLDVPDSIEGVQ